MYEEEGGSVTAEKPRDNTSRQPNSTELLREFYASKGIEIDKPMPRTLRRITWEDKNRVYEAFHREFESVLKQRK